jgi:hypothetical protein
MAQHPQRVVRVFSLPVASFDTFKVLHRNLQFAADAEAGSPAREGDPHWIDNSKALVHLLHLISVLGMAAGQAGMNLSDFAAALYMGDLKAVPKAEAQ